MSQQPDRGGAWEFRGSVRAEYSPRRDRHADPGEVVWAWVPFEEDHRLGKDRPLLVIGRDSVDPHVLVALMLSSKERQGHPAWFAVGTGPWDPQRRPSWVRLDRPLAVLDRAVRREGSALPAQTFAAVLDQAVSGPRSRLTATGSAPTRRGPLRRLLDLLRPRGQRDRQDR